MPRWRNWQTRYLEGVVGAIPWRFKSTPGHQFFRIKNKEGLSTEISLYIEYILTKKEHYLKLIEIDYDL